MVGVTGSIPVAPTIYLEAISVRLRGVIASANFPARAPIVLFKARIERRGFP
jgi:hypothetical protein